MRKHVAIAAIILLSTVAAHAQVSVYVTDSSIHLSNVATGIPFVPGFVSQQQYTSYWASGVGGGVTFDFLPLPIFSLGLDLRGSTKPGTVGADYAMVGLKLGMHPPVLRIKPYVQASAGYSSAHGPSAHRSLSVAPIMALTSHGRFSAALISR